MLAHYTHTGGLLAAVLIAAAAPEGSFAQSPRPTLPAETVVVTGMYEPVPLEEADRSVAVLEAGKEKQILFHDLTGILRLDSSVDLCARGPNNIQTDASIRGGNFGQTLVLWNGFRLNDAQSGHHNLDTPVPLGSLDRIEVLKGSGSTLYGSDAVGGVINFVSRPAEASEVRLRTALGNFGVNQQHAQFSFAGGGWSQDLALARDFSSGFRFDRDYRNLSIASETHHTGRFGATGLMLAISDRPFGADQFYGNYPSWERTKSWFAGIRQAFGESTEASFSYRRHSDLFVLYRDRPELFTNRHLLDTWQGALRQSREFGRNARLHYGAEGYYDSIESSNLASHSRGRGAAYGALDLRALSRFSLNIGAREEVYRGLRRQFSPSVSAGVWLSSRLKLRGGISNAFRLPSFTDLYYHDPANIGSPDLKPETAWNMEGGAEWRPAGRIVVEAALFQRRERDGIDYIRKSLEDIWRAANFQRLRFTGVEAGVRAPAPGGGDVGASYSALRLRVDSPQAMLSKYVSNYPVHQAVVNYQNLLAGMLLLRTRIGALQRTGRAPYALWDVAAARGRGRVRPFLQFANLTNTAYQEVTGVSMPGRAVLGGVEIRMPLR